MPHQISLVVLIPSCSILAYASMPYYAVSSVSVQFTCLRSYFFILFIRSVMKNQLGISNLPYHIYTFKFQPRLQQMTKFTNFQINKI